MAVNMDDLGSLSTIKGICILDNDGQRLVCKYFDETYPSVKEQKIFEKNLFQKTHRANSEIIMFEGITCVYRSNIDVFFYVFGSSNENELILANVLSSLYEAVSIIVKDSVEKATLFDHMDGVLLILDELVDNGIIMETDPTVLAKSAQSSKDDVPLSEQSLTQALNTAGGILRRSLLT
eukprot:m.224883 g.224883  ORF g.224883 m.224883 type:complete len:179 (+) comp16572_c0_seq1:86-622(+)